MTITIEQTNGKCPDCMAPQHVSGSSHTCRNDECRLVAPSSVFTQLQSRDRVGSLAQSGQSRAWTIGGQVD